MIAFLPKQVAREGQQPLLSVAVVFFGAGLSWHATTCSFRPLKGAKYGGVCLSVNRLSDRCSSGKVISAKLSGVVHERSFIYTAGMPPVKFFHCDPPGISVSEHLGAVSEAHLRTRETGNCTDYLKFSRFVATFDKGDVGLGCH
jgi:hypothetical protein